jgi:hypothetical protein
MTDPAQTCTVRETTLARGVPALVLENELIAATVLPGKGADIYALVSKPEGIDVLWKSPWGLPSAVGGIPSAIDSVTAWLEAYAGGWQEIFPSGGGPCHYKGVELNFHGEASLAAWDYEVTASSGAVAEIRLSTRLRRSPFLIERTMRVEAGRSVLRLRERITNQGGDELDAMWGHHPAYGAPFLSDACRIDTNARAIRADDELDGPGNELTPGAHYRWPEGDKDGRVTDLSHVPGPDDPPRQTLAYLGDFAGDHGWYGITNSELGLGVGLVWPTTVFPYAWFWQEMHASSGYPWYRGVYVMAIEPFSSIPGQGLVNVMEKTGTQLAIPAGGSIEAELAAVLYHATEGISGIGADGTVVMR